MAGMTHGRETQTIGANDVGDARELLSASTLPERPTHAAIDGHRHLITVIEDAGPDSAHTHRVRFGCGLAFDVRGEHQFVAHAVGASTAPHATTPDEIRELAHKARQLAQLAASANDRLIELRDGRELALVVRKPSWLRRQMDRLLRRGGVGVDDRLKRLVELDRQAHEARLESAVANEQLHTARDPRDHERWLTATAEAPIKADCAHCAGVERAELAAIAPPVVGRRVREADIRTGLPCPECGSEIRIRRHNGTASCTQEGHDFTIPEVQASAFRLLARLAGGASVTITPTKKDA
jgi:hypothetical protein